ncbi:MAG: hypothetical protein JWQ07_105 [Ramlibacter sp.]|nr:hypothetical protein [Ramlibacter sp.]
MQSMHGTTKPGAGRLGVAGTQGGEQTSLIKYFQALQGQTDFPFRWRIAGGDFDNLMNGNQVTARPVVHGGVDMQPIMRVPFVMLRRGEVFIGPPLRIGGSMTVNHNHLARLATHILFAGQMDLQFGKKKHCLEMRTREAIDARMRKPRHVGCRWTNTPRSDHAV